MNTEFGQIVTTKEKIMYLILEELRETNKLLRKQVSGAEQKQQSEPVKTTRKRTRAKDEE